MDSISNFLTSIRNAEMASHREVTVPLYKATQAIAAVLEKKGYITSVTLEEKTMTIGLKYQIRHHYNRISKPGRRVYTSVQEIPKVSGGFGIVILSTPEGVISGDEAKKRNLGGEVLCEVY